MAIICHGRRWCGTWLHEMAMIYSHTKGWLCEMAMMCHEGYWRGTRLHRRFILQRMLTWHLTPCSMLTWHIMAISRRTLFTPWKTCSPRENTVLSATTLLTPWKTLSLCERLSDPQAASSGMVSPPISWFFYSYLSLWPIFRKENK